MTTAAVLGSGRIPEWRLCDRMRRALDDSGISVQSMANYLEVSRNTVGNWCNGHNRPAPASLRMWAMLTGVDYEWLRDGTAPAEVAGAEDVRRQGLEPRTRWLRACPTPVERVATPFGFDRPALVIVEAAA